MSSRTIVQDYLSQLTRQLDREENKFWDTHLDMSDKGHYTFSVKNTPILKKCLLVNTFYQKVHSVQLQGRS